MVDPPLNAHVLDIVIARVLFGGGRNPRFLQIFARRSPKIAHVCKKSIKNFRDGYATGLRSHDLYYVLCVLSQYN